MNLVRLSQYKIKLQPNITASFITFIQTQNTATNQKQDQNPSKTLRTVSAVCPVGWSCLSSKTLPRSSSILLCWILCLFKAQCLKILLHWSPLSWLNQTSLDSQCCQRPQKHSWSQKQHYLPLSQNILSPKFGFSFVRTSPGYPQNAPKSRSA